MENSINELLDNVLYESLENKLIENNISIKDYNHCIDFYAEKTKTLNVSMDIYNKCVKFYNEYFDSYNEIANEYNF